MEIILIRHTTPKIEKGTCYGQADIDIKETFKEEIKPILDEVLTNSIDAFYSSPLKRCKKLAEQLNDNIKYDNRLKELNFGDWELKEWNKIPKQELNYWMENFVTIPATNGESYLDLHKRTIDFFQEVSKQNHQRIVIITHAGVMRSIWAFWNQIPLEKSFDLKLNYGQILKFNTIN